MLVHPWMESMTGMGVLGPTNLLDVFKHGAVLDDPRKPTPQWLAARLGSMPATVKNKLGVVSNKDVTLKWLATSKVNMQHPHMDRY